MDSSSVSRFWNDESIHTVMFAVGLVVGSGLTVCIMRRNVQQLENYVEMLRREVRRLRMAVDDHLSLLDGEPKGYSNNNQVLSYPTAAPDPTQSPNGLTPRGQSAPSTPRPSQILHRHPSPLRQSPRRPSPHRPSPRRQSPHRQSPRRQSPHRQSPRRQSSHRQSPHRQNPHRQSPHRQSPHSQSPRHRSPMPSTSLPPCTTSSASNSDGEEYFSARVRTDNAQSVSLDDRDEPPRGGPTVPVSTAMPTASSRVEQDNMAQMFYRVDQLMDGNDYEKNLAYNILVNKSKHRQMLQNVNFLWRLAKATYFVSQLEGSSNKMRQKNLVYKSKDIAGKALQIDNNNADAHKWWAITLGSVGEYEGPTTKIQNGFEFKRHIERSIELNPADAASHHLLGRWCYRVYILPWMERKLAAALFATPPTATIDDALRHFQESERLNPGKWKENQLYIAKCFVEKKDYRKAVVWLERASRIAVKNRSDEECQQEVNNLLTQYRGHRM